MQGFFVVRAKTGDLKARISGIQQQLAELLSAPMSTLHNQCVVSRSGRVALFAYSNEPSFGLHKAPNGAVAMVTGYTTHGATLVHTPASLGFGKLVRNLPGRFSAVVFEPDSERVAVANSVVRVDPVFMGENAEYQVLGTQASAIAGVLHGDYRFDPEAMFSFLNAGFFGTDETAFLGVRCLPAASTWFFDGEQESLDALHPAQRKAAYRAESPGDTADQLAQLFRTAFGQLTTHHGTLVLSLSGGLDSRLLLAAAHGAGLEFECRTNYQGAWGAADVYVAKLLCQRLGVRHRVSDRQVVKDSGAARTLDVDYLQRSANALKASDGTISGFEALAPPGVFQARGNLVGLGGEILRAGFAEKRKRVSIQQAKDVISFKFARFSSFFEDRARDRFLEQMNAWVAPFASHGLDGREVLDSLYADFRCGRWVGGTSRGTQNYKWLPFLDNRFADSLVSLPAQDKNQSQLHHAILTKLCPEIMDIPLANKFWPGTSRWQRLKLRVRFPQAFTKQAQAAGTTDWRKSLPSVLSKHIHEYCVTSGRLESLRGTLRLDEVTSLLGGDPRQRAGKHTLVHAVYSACVLLSGDWVKAPEIGQPLHGEL